MKKLLVGFLIILITIISLNKWLTLYALNYTPSDIIVGGDIDPEDIFIIYDHTEETATHDGYYVNTQNDLIALFDLSLIDETLLYIDMNVNDSYFCIYYLDPYAGAMHQCFYQEVYVYMEDHLIYNSGFDEFGIADVGDIIPEMDFYYFYLFIPKTERVTVTFNTDTENPPSPQTIPQLSSANEPIDPVRDGYTFGGWYTDETFTIEYEFASLVDSDTTIYAKWIATPSVVTFETNGGNMITPQDVYVGDLIIRPADPTKDGFNFIGWYKNENLTQAWNFNTDLMPANDMTLYAKWVKNVDNVIEDFFEDIGIDNSFLKALIGVALIVFVALMFAIFKSPPLLITFIAVGMILLAIAMGLFPVWIVILLTIIGFGILLLSFKLNGGGSDD